MASYQYVYTMRNLTKNFSGGREVLKDVTLAFLPGAKIGVLGVNGAGKSTLMKIMAGEDTEFNGDAWAAEAAEVGILKQEPDLNPDKDVYGNVLEGMAETHALLQEFEEISAKFSEPMDEDEMTALIEKQGELQEKIDAAGGWDLERKLEIAMDALRCPPKDADVSKLSGGERRRVALCRLLLRQPDLLLLDEPTNHLDAESVAWLEHHLEDYEGTVVAVTHDRYFLDNVAGWILELDRGRGIPFEGNYSGWLEQKQKRLALEEKAEKARQKTVAREREWIQASPRARQAKNQARITAYETLLAEAKDRMPDSAQIIIPPGPRLGDLVIEAKGLNKGFGDRLLIEGLDFKIPPGAIVGIIGANGALKRVLFVDRRNGKVYEEMDDDEDGDYEGKFSNSIKLGLVSCCIAAFGRLMHCVHRLSLTPCFVPRATSSSTLSWWQNRRNTPSHASSRPSSSYWRDWEAPSSCWRCTSTHCQRCLFPFSWRLGSTSWCGS